MKICDKDVSDVAAALVVGQAQQVGVGRRQGTGTGQRIATDPGGGRLALLLNNLVPKFPPPHIILPSKVGFLTAFLTILGTVLYSVVYPMRSCRNILPN